MVLLTYTCWGRACSATCVCGILLAWPWKACASALPNRGCANLGAAAAALPPLARLAVRRRSRVSLQCAVLSVQ